MSLPNDEFEARERVGLITDPEEDDDEYYYEDEYGEEYVDDPEYQRYDQEIPAEG